MQQPLLSPKFVIGMVHLPALPGSVHYDGRPVKDIVRQAVQSARILEETGFDGLMIQNGGDLSARLKAGPETVAAMTAVSWAVREAVSIPAGVCVLKNDAEAALGIAHVCGLQFVRVKVFVGAHLGAEGLIQGCAGEALAYRKNLGVRAEIWPDCYDLSSYPLGGAPFGEVARWAGQFAGAERLLVCGHTFAQTLEYCAEVRKRLPGTGVVIAGGVSERNVGEAFEAADGIIVGSALEEPGLNHGAVVPERAWRFMAAARDARSR